MTSPGLIPCALTGCYPYDPWVQVLWSTQIDNIHSPTIDEVTAAITLNDDPYVLTSILGWEIQSEIIVAPRWGAFADQRVGGQSVRQSELIFAAERNGDDIRTLLHRFDRGCIVILPSGTYEDYPDAPMNVYPVRVAQVTQLQRLRQGDGSQILVQFSVTGTCGENVRVGADT